MSSPAPQRLPSWLLLPGVGVLIAALVAYVQYVRVTRALIGMDLMVYRAGAKAFLAGERVYELSFHVTSAHLPFTYPPIALVLFTPFTAVSQHTAMMALTTATILATLVTAWLMTGALGFRGTAGRLGVAAAVTGAMLWTEPFAHNLGLGQINVLLMLAVIADFARPDTARTKGALIGLAAAVKLVPGIFVLYLLLTRRLRAAAVTAGSFGALAAIGFAVAPGSSSDYWLGGLFYRSERVSGKAGAAYVSNQSLHGLTLRVFGDHPMLWPGLATVVFVGGFALAVRAYRAGDDLTGVLVVALVGLLVAPIAWTHHWVWICPLMVVLLTHAARATGRARVLAAGLPPLLFLAFMTYPVRYFGALVARGAMWGGPQFTAADHYRSPQQLVLGELYTLAGLGLLLLAAVRYGRRQPARTEPARTEQVRVPAERS